VPFPSITGKDFRAQCPLVKFYDKQRVEICPQILHVVSRFEGGKVP